MSNKLLIPALLGITVLSLSALVLINSGVALQLGAQLDANSNKVVNVGTPTADGDAATKGYVDAAGGGGSGCYTIYASTTCSGGYNLAYQGNVRFLWAGVLNYPNGVGIMQPLCTTGVLNGNSSYQENVLLYGVDTYDSNGARKLSNSLSYTLNCALCCK